jgi:hypothetical protein
MSFINHLLSFSSKINSLELNKTSVNRIIWLEETYCEDDYLDPYCDSFQINLMNAKDNMLARIINNFDEAIKSKCGNDIDLSEYSDKDSWDYTFKPDYEQRSIKKRYYDIKLTPEDEKVFKKMWLRHYISVLSKIVSNIRTVTNNSKQVAIDKSKNDITDVEKQLHPNIFKKNGFEIWESMFEKFNITKTKRTDIDFMFEVMKYHNLIYKNIGYNDIKDWINKVYQISFEKIKYTNHIAKSNAKRLTIFNDIISR